MEKKKSFTLGTREANDALKEIRKSLPSGKFSSQSLARQLSEMKKLQMKIC